MAARIIAETGGNPLAIVEGARALTPEQLGGRAPLPEPLPVGHQLEVLFVRRVRELPPDTQTLLLLAAADQPGPGDRLWRAAAALGIPESAAVPAEAAGLVVFWPEVRFFHPLVRSAVYHAATAVQRRQAHRALAAACDPERDVVPRAWHLAAAAAGPDEGVAAELEAAAERAGSRGGYAAAASFLERAALLTPERERRAERRLSAAQAHVLAGMVGRAEALLAEANKDLRDPQSTAQATRVAGRIRFDRGHVAKAASALVDAARRLRPLDPGATSHPALHRSRRHRRWRIAPPPSAATAGAVPADRVGLDRDTLGAALDALTNFPGRPTTHAAHATATDHHNHDLDDERCTGLHAPTGSGPRLLLDVGVQGSDPVWLDLAETSGVGVGGPGAAGVTRTLLHRLLTHRTPVTVTAHHDTLAILLTDHTAPDHIGHTLGGTAAQPSAAVISHPRLSVAASNFDILDTAYAEIQRRSHRPILSPQTDAIAGQQPGLSALPMIDPPWVMLVPAPTSGRARQRLTNVLDTGRHYGITAIVLGPSDTRPSDTRPSDTRPSDTGTALLVDPDQRVTHHIVRTEGVDHDTAGGGLTGTQLHPTSPAKLRALLATALDATDPPGVHPPDADPPPPARISADHPGAPHTPTAVAVSPAIPQELLPAPPQATPEPMVATTSMAPAGDSDRVRGDLPALPRPH